MILTGSLDDGTAGLQAIKQRGGAAVIQNPAEALFPSMPHSAAEHVKVDYVLPLSALAEKLRELTHEVVKESEEGPVPGDMETEVGMVKMQIPPENEGEQVGTPSAYSCPECCASADKVTVSVRDEGYGISKEEQEHIFDRFYRAHNRSDVKIEGLGLGLYIAYEIVTQQGGCMWLESAPDKGSTFYFTLPIIQSSIHSS